MTGKNSNKNIYIKIVFFVLTFTLIGCSAFEVSNTIETVSGKVYVIGNEPFTDLVLITSPKKVYILKCSEKLKKELLKQQGREVTVNYRESKKSEMGIIIKVIENKRD